MNILKEMKYFVPAALALILVILALVFMQNKNISPTKLSNRGGCKQTNGDIQGLPLQ